MDVVADPLSTWESLSRRIRLRAESPLKGISQVRFPVNVLSIVAECSISTVLSIFFT